MKAISFIFGGIKKAIKKLLNTCLIIILFTFSCLVAILVGLSLAINWIRENVLQTLLEKMWPFGADENYYY